MNKKRIILNCISIVIAIWFVLMPLFTLTKYVRVTPDYGYVDSEPLNGYMLLGGFEIEQSISDKLVVSYVVVLISITLALWYLTLSSISFFTFSDKKASSIRMGFGIVAIICSQAYNFCGAIITMDINGSGLLRGSSAVSYAFVPGSIILVLFIVSIVYNRKVPVVSKTLDGEQVVN